eukprot:TRINITY_DN9290_c0_g1_i3.p1 TRINITY_DN9290_c0_g1~~TRINITY_DN9290_c0_g1_i3.p1  ORF type:complete len:508 (-),score=132.42 TRINITY_DN9290_c0_g1_i3:243-1766(-)
MLSHQQQARSARALRRCRPHWEGLEGQEECQVKATNAVPAHVTCEVTCHGGPNGQNALFGCSQVAPKMKRGTTPMASPAGGPVDDPPAPGSEPNGHLLRNCLYPAEFQAVILAMEHESRLSPIVDTIPKCLLPICNRPLISFQLELLRRAGFDKVIVVVEKEAEIPMSKFLGMYGDSEVDPVEIDLVIVSSETMGSADALRTVRHKLKSDFLVVSGDLITDVIIHYLADFHRINDSAVTMLLNKLPAAAKEPATKKSSKNKKKKDEQKVEAKEDHEAGPLDESEADASRYYVSLVKKENRLLYFRSTADIEYNRKMTLNKSMLRKVGNLTIQSDLKDSQLCIFSRWVLDFLDLNRNISSIQGELIPLLVDLQFQDNLGELKNLLPVEAREELRMSSSHSADSSFNSPVRCFAFVAPDASFCNRANTLSSFHKMNLKLPFLPTSANTPWMPVPLSNSAQIKDSVIGEGVRVPEDCTIRSSIIGKHCKIGNRVTIENSVILDYVVLEDE